MAEPAHPGADHVKNTNAIAMNTTTRSCLLALTLVVASTAPLSANDSAAPADRPAQATTTVAPQYPYLMRRAEASAEITVSFNVNAKGLVTDMKIVDSTNPEFVTPTLDALKKWTFAPALKEGKPVDSRMVQTFTFNVRSDSESTNAAQVANAKRTH